MLTNLLSSKLQHYWWVSEELINDGVRRIASIVVSPHLGAKGDCRLEKLIIIFEFFLSGCSNLLGNLSSHIGHDYGILHSLVPAYLPEPLEVR